MDQVVQYTRAMAALTGPHRDALIEATVAEFADAGYDGASLNRIIRAAGISKSSFYHAVGSKAELLDAVVDSLIADVRARWMPPSPAEFDGPAFWDQVDRVMADLAALSAEDRALGLLGRIFYLPAAAGADARSALLDTVRAWMGELLRRGAASGVVRDDVPLDALAAAAFGMLRGLDEWVLTTTTPAPGGLDAAASAPGILLRGMLAPPSTVLRSSPAPRP